jgi:hypothetical protein
MKYYSHMYMFRKSRPLLLHIIRKVEDHDDYFVHKRNTANKLGLSCFYHIYKVFVFLPAET